MKGKVRLKVSRVAKVDCIIVTYNRLELLKECLNAVENQSKAVHKIFIIDNDSTDDTWKYLKMIEKAHPNIIPVHLKKNTGGAGGFNQGIKRFMKESNSEYVWIMDDDTIPDTDALLNLIRKTNVSENMGFLASNVKWKDNSPAKMNIPRTSTNWNEYIEQGLTQIEYASFVSLLIPRGVVLKVGYPISDFFIWGDDVEYTSRINKAGYKGYLVDKSIVEHKIKDNISTDIVIEKSKNRISRYYFANRNSLYNAKRYAGKMEFIYTVTHQFFIDPIKIIFSSPNYKFLRLKASIKGNLAGIFFKPEIEKVTNRAKK